MSRFLHPGLDYLSQFGRAFSPLSLGDALAAWWRSDSGLLTGGGRKNVRANISEFRGTLSAAPTSGWVSLFAYVDGHTFPGRIFSLGDASNRVVVYSNGTTLMFYQAASGLSTINSVELTGTNVTGRWFHLFARWDNTGYEAFVDGELVQSASGDYSVPSMATTFVVFGDVTTSTVGDNYTASARIAKLAIGTTYVTGMEDDLYNLGNGLLYGSLTSTQKTNWGLLNYYNCNESLGTDDLIDQHGGDDLTPTFAELISNGGFETAGAGGSDVFGSWTEFTNGSGTIADEGTIVDAGSHAAKLVGANTSNRAELTQDILTVGHRYTYSIRARNGGSGSADIFVGNSNQISVAATGSYATYSATTTAAGTGTFFLTVGFTTAVTAYFDTVSVKAVDILPCDGPAADIASDSIGTNHGQVSVGSESSAFKWSSDRPAALASVVDGSFSFDGANDVIAAPSSAVSATAPRPISVSLWFRASSISKAIHSLYANNQSASPKVYLDLEQVSGATYRMRLYSGAYCQGDSFTLDTDWHHYLWTYASDNTVTFYRDGTEVGTTTCALSGTGTAGVWIGALAGFSSFETQGKIADVRVYNDELSSSQAVELAAGSDPTGATPVAQWKLGDGPQTPVTDGDPILEFRSKDTYRWQAIQSTQANRPEYEATGIGGRGSLVFDGSNDCVSVADNIDTGTSGCLLWVARPSALSGDHVVVSSADVGAANKYFHTGFDSAGKVYVETNVSGTTTRVTGNTVCSTGSDYVVTITSTGSAWSITVNGVAQTLTVTGSNTGNWLGDVSGRDNVVLGALITSGGTSKLLNGLLGEVVLCTDNTKADQIHTYARAYWGT